MRMVVIVGMMTSSLMMGMDGEQNFSTSSSGEGVPEEINETIPETDATHELRAIFHGHEQVGDNDLRTILREAVYDPLKDISAQIRMLIRFLGEQSESSRHAREIERLKIKREVVELSIKKQQQENIGNMIELCKNDAEHKVDYITILTHIANVNKNI